MNTVRDCIGPKAGVVWSIRSDETVYTALEKMAEKDIGALVVVDGDTLMGMFSERDYARKVILRGKSSRDTLVREIMSAPVITIQLEQTLADCLLLMSRHHIRHLPVVEGDRLVGVISTSDVVNCIIRQQEETIRFLQDLSLDQ